MFEDNKIIVRQGSQLPLKVEQGDPNAVSATIIIKLIDDVIQVTKTALYEEINGKMIADLSLNGDETMVIGVYEYQINENIDGEDPIKYPNVDDCTDDDCSFPTLEICPALDIEESS